jgi:hypothetical protein
MDRPIFAYISVALEHSGDRTDGLAISRPHGLMLHSMERSKHDSGGCHRMYCRHLCQLSFTVSSCTLLVAIQILGTDDRALSAPCCFAPHTQIHSGAVHIHTCSRWALNRINTTVHQLVHFQSPVVHLCFAAFFYLIDCSSRMLRPVSVLKNVGDIGINVIRNVYPNLSWLMPSDPIPSLGSPINCPYRNLGNVLSVDIPAPRSVAIDMSSIRAAGR